MGEVFRSGSMGEDGAVGKVVGKGKREQGSDGRDVGFSCNRELERHYHFGLERLEKSKIVRYRIKNLTSLSKNGNRWL